MIKKLHLFIFAFIICSNLNSQTKINLKKGFNNPKITTINSRTSALGASIVTYGYRASTTQTLDLTLAFSNTDAEYADSISITLPAGITPVSSPDVTFPTIDNNGGYEYLNGIIGQTITWGENNNDLYGGVFGYRLNFRIVVNVGAITGVKTGTFHLSGDGYNAIAPSADLDGTFTISPKIAGDLRVVNYFIPYTGCTNTTTEEIGIYLRNDGFNPITGTTNLSYKVNSNPTVNESTTVTIAPNDTLEYIFTTTSDFSALGEYTVSASGLNALDGDLSNNSQTLTTTTFPKNAIPYQSGFEAAPVSDLLNWYGEDNDSFNSWDTTNLIPHTGSVCFRMLETSPITCDDWIFSPCLNLDNSKSYVLKYWKRLTSGYVGSMGVFLNFVQYSEAVDQVLSPVSPLTANSTWIKDSIPFSVSSSGVYHVGFEAVNNTAEIIALRLDDFSVTEVGTLSGLSNYMLDNISMYPNPTSNILNIDSPNSILEYELHNTLGQIVLKGKTLDYGKNEIDLSSLSAGSYLIKVSNDRNVAYKKIIKK